METKRIVVGNDGDGKFEAMLENMTTQTIVCREKRQTAHEAIGALVALHYKNFELYEVVCISYPM